MQTTTMKVGTDLVTVAEVAASIERFGPRYVQRVFTDRESATCHGLAGPSAERLAARFAAKESVIKALRPNGGVDYHDIEVCLDPDGAPRVELGGSMRDHADRVGLIDSSLSMSHDGGLASAVYVAITRSPTSSPTPAPSAHSQEETDV